VTEFSFDAFGDRRGTNWQAASSAWAQNHWTDRGYTGHEHLDDVELTHMNGRVQHPGIGRFLSPDPVLGSLADPQSLNLFSYVRNNPLSLSDPSGFCGEAPSAGADSVQTEDKTGPCPEETVVTARKKEEPDEPPPTTVAPTGVRVDPVGPASSGPDGAPAAEGPATSPRQQGQDAKSDGLNRSDAEGVRDYLAAVARSRGNAGGVFFFGNRSQNKYLG
jgi:RHS repeat-associated protein